DTGTIFHQLARVDARKAEIEVAREAPRGVAVEFDARHQFPDAGEKAGAQMGEADRFPRHLALGDRGGFAQPDDQRGRQGTGTHAALLPAAVDQRRDPGAWPAPDIERADALGPIQLVARNRRKIDMQFIDTKRYFTDRLCRVGVHERAGVAGDDADLLKRLDYPDLVIRGHHRNDGGAFVDRMPHRSGIDHAVAVDAEKSDAEAIAFQRPRRLEH